MDDIGVSARGEPNGGFGKIIVETRGSHERLKSKVDGIDVLIISLGKENDIINKKEMGAVLAGVQLCA